MSGRDTAETQHGLESFDTPETDAAQVVTFKTDELTALCPFEFGGPDFYTLLIKYEPDGETVESKSFKQYLEAFRGRELSAETLASEIHTAIREVATPERLYVRLEQARRGGIEETVEVGDVDLQ